MDQSTCSIASLCRGLSSADHPSTLDLFGVSLPVRVSTIIGAQQAFWALGYMCIIGCILMKGKYVGMPFAAAVLNFGWEFGFGMVWEDQLGWEAHGHRLFMFLNVSILYQYAQMEFFKAGENNTWTVSWSKMCRCALLSVSIWAVFTGFVIETNDYGGVYSFFFIRFISSLLTTHQLWESTSPPALLEAVVPGICRLLSTAFASVAFLKIVDHSVLLSTLYLGNLVWDLIYATTATYRYNAASPKEKSE